MTRAGALLVAVLVLAACGDAATVERLSSKEALDGIDVPTIGTVGDFPDPAKRIVVNATSDGRALVDEVVCTTPRELTDVLKRFGERSPGEVVPGSDPPFHLSASTVVLRVDGALPWSVALQLWGSSIEARCTRVAFAVRHEGDRREGALNVPYLNSPGGSLPIRTRMEVVDVFVGGGEAPSATLYEALVRTSRPTVLRIAPSVPLKVALETIDAAVRAGARPIYFVNPTPKRSDVDVLFDSGAARVRADGACSFRLNGSAVGGTSAAMPAQARSRGETVVPGFDVEPDDHAWEYPLPPGFVGK